MKVDASERCDADRLVVREIAVPASKRAGTTVTRCPDSGLPEYRFIVGVSNGTTAGWWGPVEQVSAAEAVRLWRASGAGGDMPHLAWAPAMSALRHAHTGRSALACGIVDLAAHDFHGQLDGLPVYEIYRRDEPRTTSVPGYATCFGLETLPIHDILASAEWIGTTWPVQKWKRRRDGSQRHLRELVESRPPGSVAIDFLGCGGPEARALLQSLIRAPAFVEEFACPGALDVGPPGFVYAAGEHCYSELDFDSLERLNVTVWQPDALACGGFANFCDIVRAGSAKGHSVAPHGASLAAALHASALGCEVDHVEYHLTLEPIRQAHLETPIVPGDDGTFVVPSRPGWAGPLSDTLRIVNHVEYLS